MPEPCRSALRLEARMSTYTRVIRALARERFCLNGEAIRDIEAMLTDAEQLARQLHRDWISEGLRADHFEQKCRELTDEVEALTRRVRFAEQLHRKTARRLRTAGAEIRTLRRERAA